MENQFTNIECQFPSYLWMEMCNLFRATINDIVFGPEEGIASIRSSVPWAEVQAIKTRINYLSENAIGKEDFTPLKINQVINNAA